MSDSNWISDAQNQANLKKKQVEEEILRQKIEKEKKEIERLLEIKKIFHQAADRIIAEIKKVLSCARENGLIVSDGIEEGIILGPGDLKIGSHYTGTNSYYEEDGEYHPINYGIYWIIEEKNTGKRLQIQLGVNKICSENKNYSGGRGQHRIDYNNIIGGTPTITAPEVEAQIKAWLVEIYSK